MQKVKGIEQVADIGTKHLAWPKLEKLLKDGLHKTYPADSLTKTTDRKPLMLPRRQGQPHHIAGDRANTFVKRLQGTQSMNFGGGFGRAQ